MKQLIGAREIPVLKKVTYLDNAATSQTPRSVLASMQDYYLNYRASVHRGVCSLSEQATDAYESARASAAAFINASPDELVFTPGTTASINAAATMLSPALHAGDEILVTDMEHHSNLLPWQRLAKERNAVLRSIPITDDGLLDMAAAAQLITSKTKLLAISHASNVLGTINDVATLAELVHARGSAIVVVDAAQSAPHALVDVKKLGADLLTFSGHKMLGPTGIGVLYGKEALLRRLEPVQVGGGMVAQASLSDASWLDLPQKHEAGTPNIAGAIGMHAAISMLSKIRDDIAVYEQHLTRHFLKRQAGSGFTLYGTAEKNRLPVFAGNLGTVHCHDVGSLLSQQHICVRAGHHCAMPLMKRFSVVGSVRASAYIYNTVADINRFFTGLEEVKKRL